MSSMEHPVFSLATRPDLRPRNCQRGDNWLKVNPSQYGLAAVHDRDVLIYAISQCMAALNAGRKVDRRLRFKAYDLLAATNRQTSGQGYRLLKDALRLQGTQIETNIRQGGKEYFRVSEGSGSSSRRRSYARPGTAGWRRSRSSSPTLLRLRPPVARFAIHIRASCGARGSRPASGVVGVELPSHGVSRPPLHPRSSTGSANRVDRVRPCGNPHHGARSRRRESEGGCHPESAFACVAPHDPQRGGTRDSGASCGVRTAGDR